MKPVQPGPCCAMPKCYTTRARRHASAACTVQTRFNLGFNENCDVGCPSEPSVRRWLGVLHVDNADAYAQGLGGDECVLYEYESAIFALIVISVS